MHFRFSKHRADPTWLVQESVQIAAEASLTVTKYTLWQSVQMASCWLQEVLTTQSNCGACRTEPLSRRSMDIQTSFSLWLSVPMLSCWLREAMTGRSNCGVCRAGSLSIVSPPELPH